MEKTIQELDMASRKILAELYDNKTVKSSEYKAGLRFASNTIWKMIDKLKKKI